MVETRGSDFAIVASAVPLGTCSAWLALADAAYRRPCVAPGSDFVPESSSFRLHAVAGLSVVDVWSAVSGQVQGCCAGVLGRRLAIDVDQCWVRRQYPPKSVPPRHRPHSWHQDGALGFVFGQPSDAAIHEDALLRTITCWIALTPCGVDAPGLELVIDRVEGMLAPQQLRDSVVDRRWPASRRAQPAITAGDALVFTGDVLHRTHVSEAMTRARTSIELRCFPADAIPDRLGSDEFLVLA